METFLQTLALSMILVFSVHTANAAKANHDRSKAEVKKATSKVDEMKDKVNERGGEHVVSWGENARSAKNKDKTIDHKLSKAKTTAAKTIKPGVDPTNAMDWNSSRSNKTSKTSMKIFDKGTKQEKDDANN